MSLLAHHAHKHHSLDGCPECVTSPQLKEAERMIRWAESVIDAVVPLFSSAPLTMEEYAANEQRARDAVAGYRKYGTAASLYPRTERVRRNDKRNAAEKQSAVEGK